jgi:ubiquinone/menaquinone biosynthesis C-methylase UbiE
MSEFPRNIRPQDMGRATSKVFSGRTESETTRKMYAETPTFFAEKIRNLLDAREPYVFADVGAASGEMMTNLRKLLPEYSLKVIAVDIDAGSLDRNIADEKLVANAEELPFESVDVIVMRYVLQWNNLERQKKILNELTRSIRKFALVEHIGADSNDSDEWRKYIDELFRGKDVPQLKREDYFLSSSAEIEKWMSEQGIRFERLRERRIDDAANAFIERWKLDERDAVETRRILGEKNYLQQTDWIIFPKKED